VVTVKVFFEGGADPRSNPNVDTFDNTNRLRESFNKLLNSGFDNEKVKIVAEPAFSITSLVKIREIDSLFLMDLDAAKDKQEQRIKDNQLTDIQEFVFFMIQMMEAWVLSQPEVIEEVFAYYKSKSDLIKNDASILNKHPENILYPDEVLNTILQRYFLINKAGKMKKLKYGKLKNTFVDVDRLVLKINEISSKT
jgi:hypothetical protein